MRVMRSGSAVVAPNCGTATLQRVAAAAESSSPDRAEMGYAASCVSPDELALLADRGDRDRDRATGRSAHRTIIWVVAMATMLRPSVNGAGRAGIARRSPIHRSRSMSAGGRCLLAWTSHRPDSIRGRTTLARKYADAGVDASPSHTRPCGSHRLTRRPARTRRLEPTPMYFDEFKHQLPDIDPDETEDWLASLDQVVAEEGETRARFLIYKLLKRARQLQVGLPPLTQTRYINTISPEQEPSFPGDEEMERRIRRLIRWNAVAMVLRANNQFSGIGGHLATYASAATLYEVGFNHFFRGKDGGRQRRPDLLPGPRRAGHLRARVPRGPPQRGAARPLPARDRRARA